MIEYVDSPVIFARKRNFQITLITVLSFPDKTTQLILQSIFSIPHLSRPKSINLQANLSVLLHMW